MKLNSSGSLRKTLQYCDFKIGDLVAYCPHYGGDDGWLMKSELGIVIDVRYTDEHEVWQIVTVKWINAGVGTVDMASQMLRKVILDND